MNGLVLSGGADNGAYQAGAMAALAESGLFPGGFPYVSGTSVGAINGAGVAMFSVDEFHDAAEYVRGMWLNRIKSWRSIYRQRVPPYLAGLWHPSLYRDDPLRALLRDVVDVDRIRSSGVRLWITGTNLQVGRVSVWTEGHSELLDCIRASASFPVAFPPVVVDGDLHTDGYLNVAPLKPVVRYVDRLVVVLTQDPWNPTRKDPDHFRTAPSVGLRALSLLMAEAMRNDVAVCQRVNARVKNGTAWDGRRHVDLTVIAPSQPLGDSLDFDADDIRANMDLGYEDARRTLTEGR